MNNEAVEKFTDNVNAAKDTANEKIADIKENKKQQYKKRLDSFQRAMELAKKQASGGIVVYLGELKKRKNGGSSSGIDLSYNAVNGKSSSQMLSYLNSVAKYLVGALPSVSATVQSVSVNLANGIKAYYRSSVSTNSGGSITIPGRNSGNTYTAEVKSGINFTLQSQRVRFQSFSSSFSINAGNLSINTVGLKTTVSASGTKGSSTGRVSGIFNRLSGSTSVQYSAVEKLNSMQVMSSIGLEQTNTNNNSPFLGKQAQPSYSFVFERVPSRSPSGSPEREKEIDWGKAGRVTIIVVGAVVLAVVLVGSIYYTVSSGDFTMLEQWLREANRWGQRAFG